MNSKINKGIQVLDRLVSKNAILSAVADNSNIFYVVVDHTTNKFIYVTQSFCDILGLKYGDIVGKDWRELIIPSEDTEKVYKLSNENKLKSQDFLLINQYRGANGPVTLVWLYAQNLDEGDKNKTVSAGMALTDIEDIYAVSRLK